MLNFPQYQGASILLARENFGCGSSREHAPWALTDYGFKVVIAPSFADIFYGNSFNNQLLPVKLSDAKVDELFALVKANPGIHFDVDLEAQEVKAGEKTYRFTIDAFRRHCMMNGLDSIGLTLQHDDAIASYEEEATGVYALVCTPSGTQSPKRKSQQIITAGVAINTNTQSHMMSANQ